MINTIIFDIGNVLLPFDYSRAETAIAALGKSDPVALRKAALECNLLIETGQKPGETLLETLSSMIDPPPSIDLLRSLWEEIFTPNIAMVDFFRAQKASGKNVFLLSNIGPIHASYIERVYPFITEADGRVYSFEEGLMKPDPRIFERLTSKFQIEPNAAIYIDDIAENVDAAREAGYHGFVYNHRNHDEFLLATTPLFEGTRL